MSKSNSELLLEKRKFLYWISSWTGNEERAQNVNVDVPDLSVILQIMGWKLEEMEKLTDGENQNLLKIELVCHASGTRSTFTKHSSHCKCPTSEDINQMQVWTVTGCGPSSTSSQNSINSSTHSLIPTVSSGKVELLSLLLAKMFSIINDKEPVEREPANNLSQNTSLTRNRSLDTLRDNSNPFKETLKREESLEIDSTMQTSLSVPNITQTLGRISLDYDIGNYARDLEEIKKMVDEKWGKIRKGSKTTTKKRISDIQPVGPNCSNTMPPTPRKIVTPKRRLHGSGKPTSLIPSHLNKKFYSPSPTNYIKSSTNSLKKSVSVGKTNDVVFQSKIGTSSKIKAKIGFGSSTSKQSKPSVSGIQKYTKKM